MADAITITALIDAPVEKVWACWTGPEHITGWNFASDDWCCPRAENDLRVGGLYRARMEAKDGSFGFDFGGTYDRVDPQSAIGLVMDDTRRVDTTFVPEKDGTRVTTVFDAEAQNPIEMQRDGWQAILNNFKRHTESA